jgi:hypothetical protein
MSCKGLRFKDRPKKRRALVEISANHGMDSSRHDSIYRCKQYDVYLCKIRGCFKVFHRGRIDDFDGEIQLSDWLELSENRRARAKAWLAAA